MRNFMKAFCIGFAYGAGVAIGMKVASKTKYTVEIKKEKRQ